LAGQCFSGSGSVGGRIVSDENLRSAGAWIFDICPDGSTARRGLSVGAFANRNEDAGSYRLAGSNDALKLSLLDRNLNFVFERYAFQNEVHDRLPHAAKIRIAVDIVDPESFGSANLSGGCVGVLGQKLNGCVVAVALDTEYELGAVLRKHGSDEVHRLGFIGYIVRQYGECDVRSVNVCGNHERMIGLVSWHSEVWLRVTFSRGTVNTTRIRTTAT
jgi:hypothetical protein